MARRTLIIVQHDSRRLADKVDFITTPAISPAPAPASAGGCLRNRPWVIITNKGIMRFDAETKEAYLESYHPGCTIEEIRGIRGGTRNRRGCPRDGTARAMNCG
jgi:glutaconate CoA-transferase subunit B